MVAAAGGGRPDQARLRVARARHARVGARRRDRQGRARLHPRQRRRPRPSAGRRGERRGRDQRRRGRRADRHARRGGRPLRARNCVRRRDPRARARVRDLQRARARRRLHGLGPGAARRPALGGRAGLRRREHEPLDDEAPVRGGAARARGQGVLQPDDPRRVGAQHARRELSVALLVRHLRREPLGAGLARLLLQPESAGRVLRARRRRRAGVDGRQDDPRDRQQLRDAAHLRDLRARALEASRADAVPAEERAAPDRRQHGRIEATHERGRVQSGRRGRRDRRRRRLRIAAPVDRRGRAGDLRGPALLDLPPRRGDGRARLRGGRRRGRARSGRHADPFEHGHRRLDARHPPAARDRGPDARIRGTRRRSPRRPATSRRGSCPCRCSSRSGRSACSRCSTGRSARGSRCTRWSCSGLFANQAAIALDLLQRSRRAKAALEQGSGDLAVVARLAAALDALDEDRRDQALALLNALEDVLKQ